MDVIKLPLAERIQRLKEYEPAHPEYITRSIQAMGRTPLTTYFAALPYELKWLEDLIGSIDCTYQQAALRVQRLRKDDPAKANRAVQLLIVPLIDEIRKGEL